MTPDLRVALSLWLNAYEDAKKIDGSGHDCSRVKQLPEIIKKLSETSGALYEIADEEVEQPPDANDTRLVAGLYVMPDMSHVRSLMEHLADWIKASAIVNRKEFPVAADYDAVLASETDIRRFMATCYRRARDRKVL